MRRIRQALPRAGEAAGLTERERQVLQLVAGLRSNREVATALAISENTVKFHLKQAYAKLGVTSRGDAVRRARALGLLG